MVNNRHISELEIKVGPHLAIMVNNTYMLKMGPYLAVMVNNRHMPEC